jgi:hypothetical protein
MPASADSRALRAVSKPAIAGIGGFRHQTA